jgi:phospholipid/cholesterol/gamma-HCH transport system permease protein
LNELPVGNKREAGRGSESMRKAELQFAASGDSLLIRLLGEWKLGNRLPGTDELREQLNPAVRKVSFDAEGLREWNTGLLTFLIKVKAVCEASRVTMDCGGLPEGARRLLALAQGVPERMGARRETVKTSFLERLGGAALGFWKGSRDMTAFVGEASIAVARLLTGKARFRLSDLFLTMQECGARAVPIVSLISVLVGLILAFIGAVQLKLFGAQIFVAGLVGIGMIRALAAIMTGIIMAGRTGAAFAAQLGTMQVTEEIDALKTLGISPMEFLVLPRMLALFLMMPLLSLYADLMGVLGGLLIGVGMLDLNFMEYYNMTRRSVSLNDFWIGLFSAAVYGVLVAVAGCMRGFQCGRSASAVGEATTSAVVTSIVGIVVATAIITLVCNVLGI